ncbi:MULTISPECIES: D-2-hydroxyacid dehydrogenase [unclassified Sulfurimonas]|uniref:D-2-hydroxyacid dehydrogenase n=1 Tax=unclassified Sulfurimonas TaxID=2623549 RepID=UPI0008AF4EEA|nr:MULTISPECIES: D-2-hydroxyacid dehydrogenase [unclassified Sulfurimonas]OHE12313.1 MAG: hydroxyacid dehydrogenase [Sulfurimonas sp. RIFOXYC2_FULL_36_7]MBS4068805.1 D-2-hydroxyacid dehydrogenase [Sulfurimonas sp.]MDD3854445.1 D-2-hydroxyacid dehydrogenase [Sulfurimonas sp.]MDX9756686.1 D-2-hydroxyacid dehydrogenase [Sulfurimonas sp.]OHE04674.1 MAG: hydroxyacid dehydrogenase [Sulfurimonas sp. RIFOXYB12_FULL_35_9]
MKIVILDALTFGDTDLSAFFKLGDVDIYQTTSLQQTHERIANAAVIVTNKVVITKALMLNTPSLKLICVAATGMNNVDLEAAKEIGIEVKNVSGYSTDSVIQHTFSMLFYLVGHSGYYDGFVKSGSYSKSPIFTDITKPFFEVKGKKWGIIGLGTIGRGVANVAKTFGADICYYSTSGKNSSTDFVQVDLDELLNTCDIISIHAPLNEKTLNLLGYEQLLTCKNGAVVLNLGRGGIVDEEAVARIVETKNIYFGLDVLEKEPMRENHPLLRVKNQENLYITPHIAWASVEARERLIAGVVENIKAFTR